MICVTSATSATSTGASTASRSLRAPTSGRRAAAVPQTAGGGSRPGRGRGPAQGPERALLGERRQQAARLQHHGEQHRREEVEALRVAARRQRAPRVQHASQRALVEVVDAVDARPIDVDGDHIGVRLRDDRVHEVVVRPRRAPAHGVGAEAQRPAQRAVLEERRPAVDKGERVRRNFSRVDAMLRRDGREAAAAAVQREVGAAARHSRNSRGAARPGNSFSV